MRGLVLEGGGAKGSYQIGAYKALKESGYTFDYIVGTSIGSLNGAMISQGDADVAEEIWRNIKFSTVVNVDDQQMKSLFNWDLSNMSLDGLQQKFGIVHSIFKNKGFDITPLKELLDNHIDEDRVRSSPMKFGLVTVGLSDVKPLEIFIDDMEKGTLKNYLLASSYLPVFKQEPIEGKYYLDGGFYANIPYKMIDDKCDELVIIGLFPNKKIEAFNNTEKYKYIKPAEELCDIFQFMKETAEYNIQLGYFDTRKYLDGLYGHKYYIKGLREKESLDILLHAKTSIYGDDQGINLKGFLEVELNDFLIERKVSIDLAYSETLALVLESIAEEVKVDRFKIYTPKELAMAIRDSEEFYDKLLMHENRYAYHIVKELLK